MLVDTLLCEWYLDVVDVKYQGMYWFTARVSNKAVCWQFACYLESSMSWRRKSYSYMENVPELYRMSKPSVGGDMVAKRRSVVVGLGVLKSVVRYGVAGM